MPWKPVFERSLINAMFLRFAITQIDEDSHKPQGIFVAVYDLIDSCELTQEESKQLRELLDWFSENLPTPPEDFYASRAIFWFKLSAHETINRIWELVHLLRLYGYHIEVRKARRLSNISYEDEFQVAAYPSTRDSRITVQ
jgi:hypothetical protein